jgi:predicted nucleotidyltransferase
MNEAATLDSSMDDLRSFLADREGIELALLVGSRALGQAKEGSDWDFAIQWHRDILWIEILEQNENLRRDLASFLQVTPDKVDLIDLPSARLAMRAVAAEEGVLLKGDNTLPWSHFLLRTWGELEEFYWRKQHAA